MDRCTSCERVLSAEGHIPPVARIWVPKGAEIAPAGPNTTSTADAESPGAAHALPLDGADHGGRWEPRHATCLYN